MPIWQPYWKEGADLTMSVFIRKMDTQGLVRAPQIPPASLPMFGFMFLLTGQVLLELSGEPLLLHGGEFLLIPPRMPFAIRHYQNSVGFTGGFREEFLKDPTHPVLHEKQFTVQSFSREDTLFIGKIFERMHAAGPDDTRYLQSGLDFILSHLSPDVHRQGSSLTERFVNMVFDRNGRVGSVAFYAQYLGVSADLLNHHVRRYSNHSASEWIAISRTAYARLLLMDTDMSIAGIADAVGIDDPSYFSRFFRKQTGYTPLAFRKKYSK